MKKIEKVINLLNSVIKIQIPASKPFNIKAYMDLCSERQHKVDEAIVLLENIMKENK